MPVHVPNINHIQQYFGIVQTVVSTFSAGIASYAAYRGFGAWRAQLVGNANLETGRQVLRSIYKVRDAVEVFRSGMLVGSDLEKFAGEKDPERAALEARWLRLRDAWIEYDAARDEAEVLWGLQSREVLDALRRKIIDLKVNADTFLKYGRDVHDPQWHKYHALVIGDGGEKDKWGTDFDETVRDVVNYVRQFMPHSPSMVKH